MTRTWTRTEDKATKSLTWRSDDGRAVVTVARDGDGWRTTVYEDDQYIGGEPRGMFRSTEAKTARRWVKALSKPV